MVPSQHHYECRIGSFTQREMSFLSTEVLRSCKSKCFLWALSMTDAQRWSTGCCLVPFSMPTLYKMHYPRNKVSKRQDRKGIQTHECNEKCIDRPLHLGWRAQSAVWWAGSRRTTQFICLGERFSPIINREKKLVYHHWLCRNSCRRLYGNSIIQASITLSANQEPRGYIIALTYIHLFISIIHFSFCLQRRGLEKPSKSSNSASDREEFNSATEEKENKVAEFLFCLFNGQATGVLCVKSAKIANVTQALISNTHQCSEANSYHFILKLSLWRYGTTAASLLQYTDTLNMSAYTSVRAAANLIRPLPYWPIRRK